jgi:hypothetical protein
MRLTWAQVRARRLARHFLTAPGPSPADVVAAMCGAHAQIRTAGELSVGIRLDGATREAVRPGLTRTFGPRGTVHLLPTRDLPRWAGALSAVPRPLPGFGPGITLSPDELDRVVAGIGRVLTGVSLTVDELDLALADELGPWAVERTMPAFGDRWPRWRMAVDTAANRGVLCFGEDAGRKITYTNPQVEPDPGGLPWLLRSYLGAYGPATPAHFARWLSAPVPWAEALFAAGDLVPVTVEGWEGMLPAGDTAVPPDPPAGVRLLPHFDAYAVGCHPRDLVFPGPAAGRALHRGQAGNHPVVLLDGEVAGVWHQKKAGRVLDITVEALTTLPDLTGEAARIAAFAGLTPRLALAPVTVGAHA